MNIESNIANCAGLSCGIIQPRSVALLEEISSEEAIRAVEEFCARYRYAAHKIHRSVSGYFRGVCKKYWKLNREAKKQELKAQCEDASQEIKSKIIDATVDILFTKASELCKDLVDAQKRSLLLKFNCSDAIEALFEFCNAAMYREHKIRSMHAYLLNIIKRRENPAGNRMTKSGYVSHKGHYRPNSARPNSAKSSRERTRELSSFSQSPENEQLPSGDEHEEGGSLSPPITQDLSIDAQTYKPVEHLSTKKESQNSIMPGGGEVKSNSNISYTREPQNLLDPKDWEPAVLPGRILTAPPEPYRDEDRYRGGNNFRRVRRHRKRYPSNPRRWKSGFREERWNSEKQEVDPLSSIAMSRAEFTSGCGSSHDKSISDPALGHYKEMEPESNTSMIAHIEKESDLLNSHLVEPFLGMLENTDLEPGEYLPRILDPRFASLAWQHPLTDMSPLE